MNISETKSLQLRCVICIAKNLNRFNFAYMSTKDEQLKTLLLFLQKKYTPMLLSCIKEINIQNSRASSWTIERKYFKLLFNEYLKEFNTDVVHENDLEHARKRMIDIATGLQNVTFCLGEGAFYSVKLTLFMRKVIPLLKNIEILKLSSLSNFVDDTLKFISWHCPTLKELILLKCQVTNEGLKNLCPRGISQGLTLKTFELSGHLDLHEGINHLLQNMPSLKTLKYCDSPKILIQLHPIDFHNIILNPLLKYNLTSLEIRNDYLRVIEPLISSQVFPHLTKLVVPVMNVGDLKIIEKVPTLSHLEIIYTSFIENDYLNINSFLMSIGNKLNYLKLEYFEISSSVLVRSCPELEELVLLKTRMTPSNNEGTEMYFDKLRRLELTWYDSREMSLDIALMNDNILKFCSKLEKLKISYCIYQPTNRLSDNFRNFFEKTQTLIELEFIHSIIEPLFLAPIVLSCKPLKKLGVDSCNTERPEILELINSLEANKITLELNWNPGELDINIFQGSVFSDSSDDSGESFEFRMN